MSESLLISDIASWLKSHALGHANAKPRRKLLDHLHSLGHSVDDRKMRKSYEAMEQVGLSTCGLFWIVTAEDRRVAGKGLHGRAMAELSHEKRIKGGEQNEAQGSLW